MVLRSVVFPAPFGPRSPVHPSWISHDNPLSAVKLPYWTTKFLTEAITTEVIDYTRLRGSVATTERKLAERHDIQERAWNSFRSGAPDFIPAFTRNIGIATPTLSHFDYTTARRSVLQNHYEVWDSCKNSDRTRFCFCKSTLIGSNSRLGVTNKLFAELSVPCERLLSGYRPILGSWRQNHRMSL